ncbi:DUF4954 family protein [Aridibaculum aurantiacum]|uniref:DUF4954 family protein n=1 Tax=Aridibaculum aurantiacum TaxID=2810307 RepID=UPI001A96A359|nr:DUF4954 family protein [Aridibaculum aurantiacum]
MSTPTNEIRKVKLSNLGYNFVPGDYLQPGQDEYYLRNMQNRSGINYRQLTAYEIEVLVRNSNTSDDWNKILVSDAFNPELVKNCKFFGLVRIGKLEALCLEFSDLRVPVGLYNSTIISCDFGDNVVIHNVNYLSHYIIGNEVIVTNVNELVTSAYAKFGNGIVKEMEEEAVRIQLELCNENGGRSVIPFNGMLPGDAWMWTRFRDDEELLERFKEMTEAKFDKRRGYYGKIGDRTVIKNCKIIKDVWIGSDAYLKGANKLKNLTINSGPEGKSQIGEGCEMVNGIMDYGCRSFYGVKAVRFIMASHSSLKYGARLINSYLGHNSTISCCEVLNSLIFPAHEQHHNNSFLCAALVMGQSNIAAGATIGSNHNSRSADGEVIAGRGFWPGLCVSLKHNSKFASFTILAKGDYPSELNIPFPFALVNNDVTNDRLVIMPAYWFMYNMYALERNAWKYIDRDKRKERIQSIEFNYLAPDTINEVVQAIKLLQEYTGKAYLRKEKEQAEPAISDAMDIGKKLLEENNKLVDQLVIEGGCFENSKRQVLLIKVRQSYNVYKQLVQLHAATCLIDHVGSQKIESITDLSRSISSKAVINNWVNVGGQLMSEQDLDQIKKNIKSRKIKTWDELHAVYQQQALDYPRQKLMHALAALKEVTGVKVDGKKPAVFHQLLDDAVAIRQWMTDGIFDSREKDYSNPFRKMVYETQEEMDAVVGKLENNSFIKQQREALKNFKKQVGKLKKTLA